MRIFPRNIFIQNLDSFILRENFLIASIVTVFVIRFFLKITDYPQLSGAGLHIAHLLWGGFFMLVALLLVFSFMSRGAVSVASVLGGIGFGAFIDELGKFITSDNNYFFQPAIAIMYVLFISLYIFSKLLAERQKVTKQEYLVNAVEVVKEAVLNDLDPNEKKQALEYLKKSNQQDKLVALLTDYLQHVESKPLSDQSILSQLRQFIYDIYLKTTRSKLLSKTVVFILLFQTVGTIIATISIYLVRPELTFAETGQLVSSVLSGVFVILGLFIFPRKKLAGFRFFKVAILLAIFLTQFFVFYQEQFYALFGLAVNIILLAVVDYALLHEKAEK